MKKSTKDYLSQKMSIDVNDLQSKLDCSDLQDSVKSISTFLNDVTDYYSKKLSKKKNSDYVYSQYLHHVSAMQSTEAKNTLCTLRHTFTSFSEFSLADLLIYQENEDWYPTIYLTQILDTTDLSEHPPVLQIYRGCDKSELNQLSFGQSWSLCKSVAHEFAHGYYLSQPWFNSSVRTVLEAKINKTDVYFARLKHHENEVIVNTSKLYDVK